MKFPLQAIMVSVVLLVFMTGCTIPEETEQKYSTSQHTSSTEELLLTQANLEQLEVTNNTSCKTERYATAAYSPLAQYSICFFNSSKDNTEIVIELKKYTNTQDLNGSFQYESLHLRGFEGLISENTYGDQSRFYVNNESATYYYHLWIAKDYFLIHVTSKGSEEAKDDITAIGEMILAKVK
ncbi:MAG: hypothetical protein H6502_00490 [Candidatus Woesearchaeota archaeon]|nr:MAG: hypothetical protein H6502_00490 [Candidatus Woesearchaeota archaeon]